MKGTLNRYGSYLPETSMKVLKSYVQTVEIYLVDAETGNDSPSNLKHVFETHLIGKQY